MSKTTITRTIQLNAPPAKPLPSQNITFQGELDESCRKVSVTIYPKSSIDKNTYVTSGSGTSYICLRGGEPDAYETVMGWIGTDDETLSHNFKYDANPDPENPNKFYVARYTNNNPNCSDPDICFGSHVPSSKVTEETRAITASPSPPSVRIDVSVQFAPMTPSQASR